MGREPLLVPVGGQPHRHRRGGRGRRIGCRNLGVEAIDRGRIDRRQALLGSGGDRRLIPAMRFELRGERRRDVSALDRLIESQQHDVRRVEASTAAVRVRPQELHRRRGEAERVGSTECPAADGRGRRIDRDVIAGRIRERRLRVWRKDEDRRARPAERARDGRRDRDVGRTHDGWNAAKRHHRFREHDPDLVGLGEAGHFTSRAGADHCQVPAATGGRLRPSTEPGRTPGDTRRAQVGASYGSLSGEKDGMAVTNGVRARIKTRRKEPELSRHTPGRVAVAGYLD